MVSTADFESAGLGSSPDASTTKINVMKTIPFDIALRSEIQSEESGYKGRYKVQTKRGRPARIICWDKKDPQFPIVALVESYSKEVEISYRKDGKYYPVSVGIESNGDLYLIDTWEPKFELWDRIVRKGNQEITFDVVSINYAANNYGVVSDCPYADICRVAFDEQDDFELVNPLSGFNYNEGVVVRCADGPNRGSLWLRCYDKLVKSDGVTFSPAGRYSEGLYYPANKKETDMFFAELDKNGYRLARWGFITPKPKFKIGDRVRYKNSDGVVYRIADILECHYLAIQPDQSSRLIPFEDDDHLELVPEEPELTDFELEVRDIITSALTVASQDGSCSFTAAIDDEAARKITAGITKLINKKLYGCF